MGKNSKSMSKIGIPNKQLKVVVIVIIILLLIDIFFTGYLKFGLNSIRCGHPPLQSTPNGLFGGTDGYVPFGDRAYKIISTNNYYCTQADAEAAWERVNPHSDEGLRQSEQENKQLEKESNEILNQIKNQ